MPLSRFTFIVKAPGYSPEVHRTALTSEHFATVIIGVANLSSALLVVEEQARSGTQLIELCGGFTEEEAIQIRLHVPPTLPVGVVSYTAEQSVELARLFA
jgi:NADH/NAD ratio-sensing transcriptional regulator Rex